MSSDQLARPQHLHIESETETRPKRVSITLPVQPDEWGLLRLTAGCTTLDELEGCINALQDELDVLWAGAGKDSRAGAGDARDFAKEWAAHWPGHPPFEGDAGHHAKRAN